MSDKPSRKKSHRTPYVQIEVTLVADPRFQDLVRLCDGDDIRALGLCTKAILYTRQYMRNAKLIPKGVFERAGLGPLIAVDLAEVQGDEVYVRGTQRFFGFMAGACLGGKARAANAQRDGGKFAAEEEDSPASSQPLASLQPASHQRSPAPSIGIDPVSVTVTSNSSSTSNSTSFCSDSSLFAESDPAKPKAKKKPKAALEGAKAPSAGPEVWEAYREAYRSRYPADPPRGAENNKHCKKLADDYGKDDAIALVRHYLRQDGYNRYYVNQAHPLRACVRDSQALFIAMKSEGAGSASHSPPGCARPPLALASGIPPIALTEADFDD